MKAKVKLITVMVSLSVAWAFAADWPQYYGPRRDSTSTEKGILRTWPKEGPKVLWTAPVGAGFGGAAVVGGKVYLLDRDEKVGDNLRCFDLSNGKELWNFAYDAPGSFQWPGSRSTPTVDGNNVYTCGPLGDLYCISTQTRLAQKHMERFRWRWRCTPSAWHSGRIPRRAAQRYRRPGRCTGPSWRYAPRWATGRSRWWRRRSQRQSDAHVGNNSESIHLPQSTYCGIADVPGGCGRI
jgi:hypothetical protein